MRYVGATANNVFDVSDSDLCSPETFVNHPLLRPHLRLGLPADRRLAPVRDRRRPELSDPGQLRAAGSEVHFDNLTRQLYATDASIYQIEPEGVAFPRTAQQASAVILVLRQATDFANDELFLLIDFCTSDSLRMIVEWDPVGK